MRAMTIPCTLFLTLFVLTASMAQSQPWNIPVSENQPSAVWQQLKKLTAFDGTKGDMFGGSVSISGNTVVVGADGDDYGCPTEYPNCDSGSAYIFERHHGGANHWGLVAKAVAFEEKSYSRFGNSVSISGGTVIIGSPRSSFSCNDSFSIHHGSAYIYERHQTWGLIAKLTAFDCDNHSMSYFGKAVSISGDTAVVGAIWDKGACPDDPDDPYCDTGSVYIFRRNIGGPNNWGLDVKRIPFDGEDEDYFGGSVSISGDTVVVGAYGDDDMGHNSGSAYIFEQHHGGMNSWGLVAKLTAFDGEVLDWFGWSLSINGDTVVVGAPIDDDACPGDPYCNSGSVYIFERNKGGLDNWGLVKKITASDTGLMEYFGGSVSISGDTVVVGASGNDAAAVESGALYIFERNYGGTNNWGQVTKITTSDAEEGDLLGESVSISGDTVVGGVLRDDDLGYYSGSAYIFSLFPTLTITDITFRHPEYPSGTLLLIPTQGTTDGNEVTITATIFNFGGQVTATVDCRDNESGTLLSGNSQVTKTFPAGTSTQVSCKWDTSGYAWNDNGTPHSLPREIRVMVQSSEMTATVKVIPKPVILVHGLWSGAGTWNNYTGSSGFLRNTHPDWEGYPIQMDTGSLLSLSYCPDTIAQNAQLLHNFVHGVRNQQEAWHVDIVAHSMGGLIARQYIHSLLPSSPDGRPVVTHLLTLGTPHQGTPCALLSLCLMELRPSSLVIFNDRVTNRKGAIFSALAGNPWPYTCFPVITQPGDSMVEVPSALSNISQTFTTGTIHTGMTSSGSNFNNFVKPRLALGPSAARKRTTTPSRSKVLTATARQDPEVQLVYQDMVQVPAGQTVNVFISVPSVTDFGILFAGPDTLEVTLLDPNLTSIPELGTALIRSFHPDNPLTGTWTLQFTNPEAQTVWVQVVVWIQGNPFQLTLNIGNPTANGMVSVNATLTENGVPVLGATVTCELSTLQGTPLSFPFFDDGVHGDGLSNDGVYGATLGPLSPNFYNITVKVTNLSFTLSTIGTIHIEEPLFTDGFESGNTSAWSNTVP